jgi:antitoxin MazE
LRRDYNVVTNAENMILKGMEARMISSIKKFGNSSGLIIPKPFLSEVGVDAGDNVEIRVEGNCIIVQPIMKSSRQGWVEDAKRIAAEGDDALVWPEFANADDGKLEW